MSPSPTVATTIGCLAGRMDFQRDRAVANEIELIGRFAFAEQIVARRANRRLRAQPEISGASSASSPAKNGCSRTMRSSPSIDHSSLCDPAVARIAAASSVMSIPTGHQVMQRPQPTQPEVPN